MRVCGTFKGEIKEEKIDLITPGEGISENVRLSFAGFRHALLVNICCAPMKRPSERSPTNDSINQPNSSDNPTTLDRNEEILIDDAARGARDLCPISSAQHTFLPSTYK
jgi:hypothetical protein